MNEETLDSNLGYIVTQQTVGDITMTFDPESLTMVMISDDSGIAIPLHNLRRIASHLMSIDNVCYVSGLLQE